MNDVLEWTCYCRIGPDKQYVTIINHQNPGVFHVEYLLVDFRSLVSTYSLGERFEHDPQTPENKGSCLPST
jgi:hypothetical protein